MDSETTLKEEIAWASYLSLKACLLPAPKGTSFVNYARCVNQILQNQKDMQLWLRIPLGKADGATSGALVDSWDTWNSFRQICEHPGQLSIVFDNLSALPSDKSLERWFGESVSAAILHTDIFLTKTQGTSIKKYLSKRHQKIVSTFFHQSIQIIIYGGKKAEPKTTVLDSFHPHSTTVSSTHPLRPYLDCVGHLYTRAPLSDQEFVEFDLWDSLHSIMPPINHNLVARDYMYIEKDKEKYIQYQRAICQALRERVPDEKASEITTVLMVVGAGRGLLVKAAVEAAAEAKRKLKVYAVEKNDNAVFALTEKMRDYENIVTVVSSDVRYWNAPETADILVSELLGSFGDNKLSPEILDAAQRFLKEDGISIPTSYTGFLQPLTASKLYGDVKNQRDISQFEAAFAAKIHNVVRLAPPQPVFTFSHPKNIDKESNQRYKKLHFLIHKDLGSAMVHGFAGYMDATLYKDVHLASEPSRATPELRTWSPMFFPLRTPICVDGGSTLEVHFWRCCNTAKVWYEWCVTAPISSPIYNSNGCVYWMGL